MKLDILVIAAHPDDAELCCGGTILAHTDRGKKVGIIDLTRGELGTRGTMETREQEAQEAAQILGVEFRENLGFRDGFFVNDETHQIEIIKKIRQYRPELILTNATSDRHPDHGRASELVEEASFYAGLRMVKTSLNNKSQEAWRPHAVLHFIQYYNIEPDFVVNIENYADRKMEAVLAFKSQFYDPDSEEPETILSTPAFLESIRSRWRSHGNDAHLQYAEGFTCKRKLAVDSLFDLKFGGMA